MENSVCESSCTSGLYADPSTRLCSASCTNSRYGDPTTNTCVETCPVNYFRDPSGYCKNACSPLRADNVSLTCTSKCSEGLWGHNNECVSICPDTTYGYEPDRDCYTVANRPNSNYFAENDTNTWVTVCPYEPLTYGNRQTKYCVSVCEDASLYADPLTREC